MREVSVSLKLDGSVGNFILKNIFYFRKRSQCLLTNVISIRHRHRLNFRSSFHSMILNPLMTNIPYHIETSQLICIANYFFKITSSKFRKLLSSFFEWSQKLEKILQLEFSFSKTLPLVIVADILVDIKG